MTDEYFMQQALKEADKALDADEVPIGAVVVTQLYMSPSNHARCVVVHYIGVKSEN
jgi:tRNA(Arg) A34 adenosine deaminase TadA